jgi:hypothetical protein
MVSYGLFKDTFISLQYAASNGRMLDLGRMWKAMVMVKFKVFALFGGTNESDEKEHVRARSLMTDNEPGTPDYESLESNAWLSRLRQHRAGIFDPWPDSLCYAACC